MGGGTYVVSLPASWVKKHDVQKGDELNLLVRDGGDLVIRTDHAKKLPSLKMNLENGDEALLVRTIVTAYRLGYGELELVFPSSVRNYRDKKDVKSVDVVHDTCDQLIGFEVIKHTDLRCSIKDVAGTDINEFQNILRRIFLMLNSFGSESLSALHAHDMKAMEELRRKHLLIRKFVSYCQRYLSIKGMEGSTLLYNELVLGFLELSQTYRFLTKVQAKETHRHAKEVLGVYEEIVDLQEQFYTLFYTYSLENARTLIEMRMAILEKINKVSEHVSGKDLVFLHRLPPLLNTQYSLVAVVMALHFDEDTA